MQRSSNVLPITKSAYPWLIVGCGMLFYCYNYFLRISPSVMHQELTQTFALSATQFGLFTTLYYLAYTPMQLPAGMIYDKFGPRIVLCLACLAAVGGLCLFIITQSYYVAGLGRFLIGLGGAFSYIGTLKLASLWLPKNRFAVAAGFTTAIGMLSGALSQTYLTQILEVISYQKALSSALIAGVLLSLVIFMFVKNKSKVSPTQESEMQSVNLDKLISALIYIIKNRQMWLIGIIGCLLYLPASVFLDLWGIPYLKTVYHVSALEAANITSITFYGWIIGGPVIGAISDKMQRRKMPLIITGAIAAILLSFVFYVPGLKLIHLYIILFIAGFCCGAHPLCFALGKENNPLQISGTSVATTNMLIMTGGVIFQPVVGLLLDYHSRLSLETSSSAIYSAGDYTFAMSVVPIGVALGIILSLFLKETYCESQCETDNAQITNIKSL